MTYNDLTLNQRIGLKGLIETRAELAPYRALWLLWNFKVAINFFFNDDLNSIP